MKTSILNMIHANLNHAIPNYQEVFRSKPERNLQNNRMTADYKDYKSNFHPAQSDMRIHPVNDLATLEVLDEQNVLETLGNRFNQKKYYTYIGDILVAINPCEPVNLYGDKNHEQYKELYNRSQEDPHIYWVADELYRNLRDTGDDQCGIVSGESGAGKTESIKHILNHLIRLGPNNVKDLVEQLDQVNPLLELFGNATTSLNQNSSRFCKFIELQYTAEGQLRNGQIQCFILEKSRLIKRHQNEKNFHIFYALLGGLSPDYKQQFILGDVADYRILANEDEAAAVFVNHADFKLFMDKFEALEIALQKIGFQSEEISNIYSVLSAILNLTNISFDQDDNTEELHFEDEYLVRTVAELLNIQDIDGLKTSLLKTSLNLEQIYKQKTLAEANEGRDALAKELYQRLFSCIIDKINSKLKESVTDNSNLQTKKLPTINLLDISGFEKLKVNGFEQLLINTANEVLHQIFLNHVMKREQEEYEREGVRWTEIVFCDNEEVINLITRQKPSIFSILEEAASVPTGNDKSLINQLNQNFKENPLYKCENIASKEFGICHYADKVTYNVAGFTEKTKDTLSRCLKDIIEKSGNPLVKINPLTKPMDGKRASMRRKRCETVTEQFKASLRQLQTKLNQSNLIFVRCLKPNPHLRPTKFDTRCMGDQLKACGLAKAAMIRRYGYPVRLSHSTFLQRYESVIPTQYIGSSDIDKCKSIIETCRIHNYHIGKTKILLDYTGKCALEMEKRTILQNCYEKDVPENIKKRNLQRADGQSIGSSLSTNCHIPGKLSQRNSQKKNVMEIDTDEDQNANAAFQMDQSKIPAYDAFRECERPVDEDSDFFTKMLKFLRFLFYIFLICGILISAVSNRLGLLLLAGSPNKKEEHAKLFLSLGIPMLFSWGWNAMSCAFRGKVKTSWRSYICIGALEISRTVANGVLVFLLLPTLGLIRGLIMMYGIGQVPALLLFLETIFSKSQKASQNKRRLGYLFVFILQLGIIPAYLATNFLIWTDKNGSGEIDRLRNHRWIIPIVIIGISLSLWENYALFDIKIGMLHIPLSQWRKQMMRVRESTNFFIEPLKIIIFWLISQEIANYDLAECWETYKTTIHDPVKHLRNFGIMYLEILSAMICTYLSGMACKLHMQRVGFATPLVLVMPVSIVLSYFLCDKGWIPKGTFTTEFQCCKIDILNELLSPIIIALIALITTLAITFHIWEPKTERMAHLSKLFVPQFDPLLLDVSLLLRRRQDHKEKKEKSDDDEPPKPSKPKLLVCATTWHETRQEMVQLLKSLFRLDFQNKIMELTPRVIRQKCKTENDNYELSVHIIFDDAWEKDDNGQEVPNSFVKEFVTLIPEAAMSVAKGYIDIKPVTKVTTPYGGRLEMKMPGGTEMVIHLKNKEKIRHRKRWSQVMYLYYLLGFKSFDDKGSVADVSPKRQVNRSKVRRNISILNHLSEEEYAKIENTFLLTLDGDVDFKPDSVKLLIDRMIMNKKVGAVCGRIHPIGSGPMIWYQQFEYAVGHWLQKAAEHVFGCVLCCPGCFSLFRASALMDDNVMRAYTRKPIVARDYIQYEQGEDRWLCTLLLQQGYRIDYCAGADAYTFAPETFHDFYIQRRRWAPSTIANIMDLLSTWHTTVYLNDNISVFFMFYQFILMTSSILAPATVVLMIAGSYNAVLKISMWKSFVVSLVPVVLYIIICLKTKTDTQINIAAFMTSIYSVVMVIVTVGTIINILQDEFVAPNVVFLVGLTVVFCVCGILHPREIICLVHGILYFLTVPSSFIFLTIYFLCNLNIVTWGTREVAKKLTPEEEEEAKRVEEAKKKKKRDKSFFNVIGLLPLIEEIKKIVYDLLGKPLPTTEPNGQGTGADVENQRENICSRKIMKPIIRPAAKAPVKLNQYYWTSLSYFGNGESNGIEEDENDFWKYIINKYLDPLQENKDEKEKIKKDLEDTRNNVVFGYFLLNLLWSVAIMQLQTMKDEMLPFFIAGKYEPISVMFLGIFGIVLILQFIGMCVHRWGTFLHLMSTTHLRSNEADRYQRLEKIIKKMASASDSIDLKNYNSSYGSDSEIEELDDMRLPPADYDSDEIPGYSAYEQFYIDRMKTLKVKKRQTPGIYNV